MENNLKVDENNNIFGVLQNEMEKWRGSLPIAEPDTCYKLALDALLAAQNETARSLYMEEVVDCRRGATNNNKNIYNLPLTRTSVYIEEQTVDLEIRDPSPSNRR